MRRAMPTFFVLLIIFTTNADAALSKWTYNAHTGKLDRYGMSDSDCINGEIPKKTAGAWECGADSTAAGGGDDVSIDSVAVVNPDFVSTGDIDFIDTANTVTANVKANSVALTTDTTGNYAAGDAEGGAATTGDSATAFFSAGTIEDARLPTSMADKTITGSLVIPQGAAPTVDAVGEAAIDTTDDQFQYYGGAKRIIPYTLERCLGVESITTADDNVPFYSPVDAITVTGVYCRTQGGTSAGITISDGTNAFEEVVCDSDGQADDGTITNAGFTANERMEFDTGTVTGTVTWTNICVRYTTDSQ